jgi:hypothetical protein
MGFTEDCSAIVVLRCKTFRKLDIRPPQYRFHVQPAYVAWKNLRAHSYVKAQLRYLSLLSDEERDYREPA